MKMSAMGHPSLVQRAAVELPGHSGSIQAAPLEDLSAKGEEQSSVTQIWKR